MSTRGNASSFSTLNGAGEEAPPAASRASPLATAGPAEAEAGRSNQSVLPVLISPTGPRLSERKVSTLVVLVLLTLRDRWIESFRTTITPRPRAPGLVATATALYKFAGPSAPIAVAGRIEPVKTIGLSSGVTRSMK